MMILRDKFLLLNCQNSVLERQHSVTLCSTTSDHFLGLDGCGSEDILSKIKIKKSFHLIGPLAVKQVWKDG